MSLPRTLALIAAAFLDAGAFEQREENELLEFVYAWPALVEDEPQLRARLRADMESALREAREGAELDRRARADNDFPYHRHSYERRWELAGATPRLVSLASESHAYTGGAHGNIEMAAILWDRLGNAAVEPLDLFDGRASAALARRYCASLDAIRAVRRGGAAAEPETDDPFNACPPLTEQVVAPLDADGNGRFETLRVLIPPYAAGPWVEGSYLVEVPLRPSDLTALSAEYQDSFEASIAAQGERG